MPFGDSSVRLKCTSGKDIEDEDEEAAASTRVMALVEKHAMTSASSRDIKGILWDRLVWSLLFGIGISMFGAR